MNRSLAVVAVCSGLLFATVPTAAHHSFEAEYDRNKPITLKGKVTKVEWQNPHVYYYVDVVDEKGATVNWAVEIGAPNGLYRAGWRRDSLKPGDEITVDGFRAKTGGPHINGRTAIVNGQKLFSGQNDGGPGSPARN